MIDMTDVSQDRAARGAAALDAVETEPVAPGAADVASLDAVEEALKDVVDPELGVNIVDLGLIYDLAVGQDNVATIDMTLTRAACPLTDLIEDQIAGALTGPGGLVEDFAINWVWMPPWDHSRITEDGREQLRALGFNV
jgi:metal-sulfur cluster biosynthetic enzyme